MSCFWCVPSFETVSSASNFFEIRCMQACQPSLVCIIEKIPNSHVLGSVCANEYVKYLISMSQCFLNMNNLRRNQYFKS